MSNLPPKPVFEFDSPSRHPSESRPYHRPPPPGNGGSPDRSYRAPSSYEPYPSRTPSRTRHAVDSYVASSQAGPHPSSYDRGREQRYRDSYRDRERSPGRERDLDRRDRGPPQEYRYRGSDSGRERDDWRERDRERERSRDEDPRWRGADPRSRGAGRDRYDRNRPRERDWRTRDEDRRYSRGPPNSDRSWIPRQSKSPPRHIDNRVRTPPTRERSPELSPRPRPQSPHPAHARSPSPVLSPGQVRSPRRASRSPLKRKSRSPSSSPARHRSPPRDIARRDRSPLQNGSAWNRGRVDRSISSTRSRRRNYSRGRSPGRDHDVYRPRSPDVPPTSAKVPSPSPSPRKEPSPQDIVMRTPKLEEATTTRSPSMQRDPEEPSHQAADLSSKEKGKMREGSGGYDGVEPEKPLREREIPSSPASVKDGAFLQARQQRRSHSPPPVSRQYGHISAAASLPHVSQHAAAVAPPLPTKPDWSRRTSSALPPNARPEGLHRTSTAQTTPILSQLGSSDQKADPKPSSSAPLDAEISRLRAHRAQLTLEYVNITRAKSRALHELDMASIDLKAAEKRRTIADAQLEKARFGALGVDFVR